jgi:hypothetical protein
MLKENNKILKTREFRYTLINTLSFLFTDICKENDILNLDNDKRIIPFLSKKNQSLSIKKYLLRLVKYTQVESSTLIAMLIYIDRLCEINNFTINSLNIYKIIFSSLVLAIKYNEEVIFDNKFFARIGGISLSEMNFLEIVYLNLINFKLYVSDEIFETYIENINETINKI